MKKLIFSILFGMLFLIACDDGGGSDDDTPDCFIRVRGFADAEVTDFTCNVSEIGSSSGEFFDIDSVLNIPRQGSGTYILSAEKDGYTANPDLDTVTLTSDSPTAEVFFIFTQSGDTTLPDTSASITYFFFQNEGDPYLLIIRGPEGVDTIDVGAGGSFWNTKAGTGDRLILFPEREGYCAEPESLVLLVDRDDGAYTYEFEFYEQHYSLYVDGNFTGLPIEFDLLLMTEEQETLYIITDEGLSIELAHSGEYLLYPAHTSLMPESTVYHLNMIGCRDSAILSISFFDTVEYSLTLNISGDMDGEPIDFEAAYRIGIPGASWDTVDVGSEGLNVELEDAGYYFVRARHLPYMASPEEAMVFIDGASPEANAHFTFIDTTTPPKKIFIEGKMLTGESTAFNLRYLPEWEDSWIEHSIPAEGETLRLYPDGEIEFQAEKDGFVALPATRTLEIEGEGTEYDVSFSFGDSLGYLEEAGIYVADWYNYRVVRFNNMVTGEGWTTVGPLSGYGTIDGPTGVNLDVFGRIFVIDRGYNRLVMLNTFRDDSPYEVFTSSHFNNAQRLEFDSAGRIYITSEANNKIIRIDDMAGTNMVIYNTPTSGPFGIDIDNEDRIYFTNKADGSICRINDIHGSGFIEYGSTGSGVGNFHYPLGITVDTDGRIYIADKENNRLVRIEDMEGTGWTELHETSVGPLNYPTDIEFSKGQIYFTEYNSVVRMVDFDGDRAVRYGEYGAGFGQFHHLLQISVIF